MHPLNLAQRGEINAEQSLVLTLFCKICPAFLWKLETLCCSEGITLHCFQFFQLESGVVLDLWGQQIPLRDAYIMY
ncbi:hypothetical protein NC653_002793 [Populus alba x Populus x berolinensis]|uniref:Uncharacterized protein n=1 Tax=Populus alba x Populus x berolinensis TaxID=444605 RepID=A0AAD6WH93_9ROSI|nr:hypothetical protein NC653_002793 [Populus alba x Populus x berolinensis]